MSIKFTLEQQYENLIRNVDPIVREIKDGYDYDPGSSDLDNEQPISVRMTLGEYRNACHLFHEFRKPR